MLNKGIHSLVEQPNVISQPVGGATLIPQKTFICAADYWITQMKSESFDLCSYAIPRWCN